MVTKKQRKVLKRKVYFLLRPLKKYLLDKEFRKRAIYAKYREKKKLNDQYIFYEAYHGQSMTGNPYAVFKYLIDHPDYQNFIHVWAVQDKKAIHREYRNRANIIYVKYRSIPYIKYLAVSKYLINDTTFPYYFHKREGQIYANIWHGTPLKKMGIDIQNRGFTDHKNIQKNFLSCDFLVSPNRFTAETLLKSHDVGSLYHGKILNSGYPRVDLMFNAEKEKLKELLSIPSGKRVILYAPTWRGKLGEEKNESEKLLEDVQKLQMLLGAEYIVLLKSHYYAYRFFKEKKMDHVYIPNQLDTNELLSIADILITDYSSIFFEFLATERPVLFYTYDAEEYLRERGTYIPLSELPGPQCKRLEEAADYIQKTVEWKKEHKQSYQSFREKYASYDDGHATQRFIDAFFHQKSSENLYEVKTDKTKILLYGGGFLNNGITTSVINLLNAIDYNRYDVTLIDYGNNTKEEKWANLKKLNPNVRHIFRTGSWNATLSDWYRHNLVLQRGVYTKFMQRILPEHMYRRELERITGGVVFDIGIDFSGYSPFWSSIIGFGNFKKKNIFLHNDMGEEMHKKVLNRYPHRKNLKVIFSLYNYFDKIISVSKLTNEQNRKKLNNLIKNHQEKMDYVINSIDYRKIISMKEQDFLYEFGEEIDFSSIKSTSRTHFPLPDPKNINFINIGRLGPEKDQEKLINAFAHVAQKHSHTMLYIVGDGDLREQLSNQVKRLRLTERVIFTGQIRNPYSLLNLCDCFILSSNHEGQPMVLLEALVLGKPIIVTDIPGSRSVVEGGYGLIVENSIEGLESGMELYIQKQTFETRDFDYEAYSSDAISMFYEKVCSLEKEQA